ncbi:Hypothetical predicted protein [Marmota monax]|uniref:Uncharacterized protein n=1 Tax=Marmota monax TaxID=9995 RepID=A0A5E4CPH7_MARMO|nr:Hypothetical predicted protein [Marmota monax]
MFKGFIFDVVIYLGFSLLLPLILFLFPVKFGLTVLLWVGGGGSSHSFHFSLRYLKGLIVESSKLTIIWDILPYFLQRLIRQIRKEIQDLNKPNNRIRLIRGHRTLHCRTTEYTFFASRCQTLKKKKDQAVYTSVKVLRLYEYVL